jgi:glycosyltransferase involved in cell wall biosynthesis
MITIYTLAYNEQTFIQYMIDHYKKRFPSCHIVIYDNSSTDQTVEIAKRNGCEVRTYNTNNSLDDGIHMNMKNNMWKDAKTDWVLVCDLDELLDINENDLRKEASLNTTIIKPEGWSLINFNNDFNIQGMTHGYRDPGYDKSYLFNKKFIKEINFGAGAHVASPVGVVKYSGTKYYLYHYKFINEDLFVSRSQETSKRLSANNIRHNWGIQCMQSEQELRDKFHMIQQASTLVPKREIPIMEHFYQNIQGWFNYQDLYTKVVGQLPNNSHIVEIGAWKGCSTSYLAVEIINSKKNIKFDVIDTWKGTENEEGHMTDPDIIKYNGDIFQLFLNNIASVKHVVNPIQLPSNKAYTLYDDKSLDFVFLDANHAYEPVKEDIKNWLPKIKDGGVFAGHDWNLVSWPGVVQAVKESFDNSKIIVIGECWYINI